MWLSRLTDSQAKNAYDHLNGFHLQERYLVGAPLPDLSPLARPLTRAGDAVLYHQQAKQAAKDLAKREADLAALKKAHNIKDDE